MRSDGYCSCLQTRHSKKDAQSCSDPVLKHQEDSTLVAETSGSASPSKWKDEDLAWFPNPKGDPRSITSLCQSVSTSESDEVTFRERKGTAFREQGTISPLFRD